MERIYKPVTQPPIVPKKKADVVSNKKEKSVKKKDNIELSVVSNLKKILNSQISPTAAQIFVFENVHTKEEFESVLNYLVKNASDKKLEPYIGKLIDAIGQNGQRVSPEVWIENMSDLFSVAGVSGNIKDSALSATNYIMSFYEGHIPEILKKATLEDISDYNKTGKLIKFLFYLGREAKGQGFSEKLSESIKETLGKIAEPKLEKNYLLTKFAGGALEGLENKHNPNASGTLWFAIQKDQYGAVYEDGFLHISDAGTKNDIDSKTEKIHEMFKIKMSSEDGERLSEIEKELAEIKEELFPSNKKIITEINEKNNKLIKKINELHDENVEIFKRNNPDFRALDRERVKRVIEIEDIVSKNTITPKVLIDMVPGVSPEEVKKLYPDYLFMLDGIMRPILETDFQKDIFTLSIPEQLYFLNYLKTINNKQAEQMKNFCKTNGLNGLRTFLSIAHGGKEMGDKIITIGERLPEELAEKVFQIYSEHVEKVAVVAGKVFSDLKQEFPNLLIDEDTITQSLLVRAKDFLVELEAELQSNPEGIKSFVNKFITEIKKESPQEQVVRAQFKTIANLLNHENVDLKNFENNQDLILHSLGTGEQKALMFRALNRMNRLSPVPEIHWRVDRSSEEYDRRLGINVNKFLQERSGILGRKQILLEIGPGSGVAKSGRTDLGLSENYQDIALSDKIYYPLSSVVEKLIDYSELEKIMGKESGSNDNLPLSAEEKSQLADFIYKTIVIKQGETSFDTFTYDEQNQMNLTEDINNLKNILGEQLGQRLKSAKEVPDTVSMHRDGKVVYPNKIKVESWSPKLQMAKKLLEENPTNFLRSDWEQVDYYDLIEAFPANVMVGDLDQISQLRSDQVDVELAVRSTVYKKGEDYVQFLGQLFNTLSEGGVAIDDSIRDNDGWYYRIAEVLEAQEKFGDNNEVLVILGPGFQGEDKRQDKVPLSLVITKKGSSIELIKKNLLPGYEIVSLENLSGDQDYLLTLDDTGLTKKKVNQSALAA
ncbi:MAG: hypothetical protein V4439_02190 [Patescibacteria group bacterium]